MGATVCAEEEVATLVSANIYQTSLSGSHFDKN